MFVLALALGDTVSLFALTVPQARKLDGTTATVRLIVGKPAYSAKGVTMAGTADPFDGVERVVTLRDERYDVRQGEEITVTGTLRVIRHRAAVVNRVRVPAWAEIREEELRR